MDPTEGIDPADLTDEQLEALENGPNGSTPAEPEPDDEPDEQEATAPEAPAADDSAPGTPDQTTAPAPEQLSSKPAGIASKNGKHVLPFHVLQAERRRADEAARRAEQLERELADLKAGKKPDAEAEALTEDEVAQMEQDFPEHGRKLRAIFEKAKSYEQSARAEPEQEAETSNPIQDAIDQIPLLVDWQAADPEKFARAQEIDDVLKKSPKWRGKPIHERFAHVAKTVADEYDIPYEDDEPAPTPSKGTAPRNDPSKAIANAARTKPNTLSDFKGGATPDTPSTNFERLSPTAQVDRWAGMSDDEIDAALARSGG